MRKAAFYLSLAFIFSLPWEDSIAWGEAGSANKWIGLAAGLAWVSSVITSGRIRPLRAFHVAVVAFFGWALASIVWGGLSFQSQTTLVLLALMSVMLWDLYRDSEEVAMATQAFVLGAFASVISLFVNFNSGTDILLERYGVSTSEIGATERYSAIGSDPNALGISLAAGVAFAAYLLARRSDKLRRFRWLNGLYIPAAVVSIALTGSRSATLALIPAALYMIHTVLGSNRRRVALMALTIVVAVWGVQQYVPDVTLNRILGLTNDIGSGNLGGRELYWAEGADIFAVHPLVGVGAYNYVENAPSGRPAHSVPITIAAELGIIGLLLFTTAVLAALAALKRMPAAERSVWLAQLGVWGVGVLTLSWTYVKFTWVVLGLVVVASAAHEFDSFGGFRRTPARGYGDQDSVRPSTKST